MSSILMHDNPVIAQMMGKKIVQAQERLSSKWQWRLFIVGLLINDFLMIGAAFRLAYLIRFRLNIPLFALDVMPYNQLYDLLMLFLIPVWILVFSQLGLYNRDRLLGGTQEYSNLFNSTLVGVILVIAAGFLYPDLVFARGWLLMAWALSFLMLAIGRFTVRRIIYALRQKGYYLTTAVIVGANDEGRMLATQLMQWKTSGFHICGFIDKKLNLGEKVVGNLVNLGSVEHLNQVIRENYIEDVILASSAISSRDKLVEIIKEFAFDRHIRVRFSSGLYEIMTTGVTINQFASVPLMEINPVRLSGIDRALKLALDYSLGTVAAVLALPIMAIVAILVKLDSRGPIIHKRRIVGLNGKQFNAFKFRTMHVDGDTILAEHPELLAELKANHKLKDDPRITRIGKILRKLSLDELPQVFNVLKGEMSLVGPRMITPEELEKYTKWDLNLLTVRPGITGLWQVSGRSDVSYDERVRIDMYYIRNWNIWLDIQIILQTIPAVLKSRGAY